MMDRDETPRRRAYMLCFWEVRSHNPARPSTWRFSLEDPHSGDKLGFADLESLMLFLRAEVAESGSQAQ